jgi:hypothetical protein
MYMHSLFLPLSYTHCKLFSYILPNKRGDNHSLIAADIHPKKEKAPAAAQPSIRSLSRFLQRSSCLEV